MSVVTNVTIQTKDDQNVLHTPQQILGTRTAAWSRPTAWLQKDQHSFIRPKQLTMKHQHDNFGNYRCCTVQHERPERSETSRSQGDHNERLLLDFTTRPVVDNRDRIRFIRRRIPEYLKFNSTHVSFSFSKPSMQAPSFVHWKTKTKEWLTYNFNFSLSLSLSGVKTCTFTRSS